MQIKDSAAIVFGGASGLGEATARRLAAEGAIVTIADLNPASAPNWLPPRLMVCRRSWT